MDQNIYLLKYFITTVYVFFYFLLEPPVLKLIMISSPDPDIFTLVLKIFDSKLVACRRIAYVCLCRGSQLSSKIFHLPTIRLQGTSKIWLFGHYINIIVVLSLRWSCRRYSPSPPIFRPSSRKERSNSYRECRYSFVFLIRATSIKGNDIQRCCRYHWDHGKGNV